MKSILKNKRGFTLIEVMLAIAIICLIGGLFVELLCATTDSYYRTYNQNDAADYAQLYARAIENNILRDIDVSPDDTYEYSIVGDGSGCPYFLQREGTNLFSSGLAQITNSSGVPKWRIYIGDVTYTDHVCSYTLYMVDNYRNPGTLVLEYPTSFYVPEGNTAFYKADGSAPRTIQIMETGTHEIRVTWDNHSRTIYVAGSMNVTLS